MSAHCSTCGNLVYPPGTWPLGTCLVCGLREKVRERDALLADAKDALAIHKCPRKSGYQVRVVELSRDTYRQVGEPGPLPVDACPTCALLARIEELEGRA